MRPRYEPRRSDSRSGPDDDAPLGVLITPERVLHLIEAIESVLVQRKRSGDVVRLEVGGDIPAERVEGSHPCDMLLKDLATGNVCAIAEARGRHAAGCRLDFSAETVRPLVALTRSELAKLN